MPEQRAHQSWRLLQRAQEADNQLFQMFWALDRRFTHFVVLEMVPHQFVRIQVGAIRRQVKQPESIALLGYESLDRRRSMHRMAIDDQEGAR